MDEIICNDCIEAFKSIEDESFDLTFADSPFNLNKKYSTYKDNKPDQAYLEWCEQWISEMIRVTKPSGAILIHNIPKWLIRYCSFLNQRVDFKHWIAWDAPSSPMGKSLQPSHYGILYFAKPDHVTNELRYPHKRCRKCQFLLKDYGGKKSAIHPFGPLIGDVWSDIHRCKHDKYRDAHACQLPIHLMERLILMTTEAGDSILDCFMGTGTTAIAAKRLGRRYLGIEISDKYVAIANAKLERETVLSCINGIWISCYLDKVYTIRDKDIWDTKNKVFSDEWANFYNWFDDRTTLDRSGMKFRDDVQKKISKLCSIN